MADEKFVVVSFKYERDCLVETYGVASSRPEAVKLFESRATERPDLRSRDRIRQFLEGETDQVNVMYGEHAHFHRPLALIVKAR